MRTVEIIFGMDQTGKVGKKPRLILLDVYETLLNVNSVRVKLNESLHNKRGYRVWIELCMQYAFVDIITGEFHRFEEHAREALKSASEIFGESLPPGLNEDIFLLMKHAPIHEDVQEGLSELSNDGYLLTAMSNVSSKVLYDRMENTGLISYFNFILSAEDINRYRPSPYAYAEALKKAEVQPEEALMVTTHWWDLRGAEASGLQTAFLKRESQVSSGLYSKPSVEAESIGGLAKSLRRLFD
jgi:2-haloacid dehalogenase